MLIIILVLAFSTYQKYINLYIDQNRVNNIMTLNYRIIIPVCTALNVYYK